MKKLLIFYISFLLLSVGVANADKYDDQVKSFDKMFQDINQKRLGLENSDIESAADPFTKPVTQDSMSGDDNNATIQKMFSLKAILIDRAKIDKNWYKKGDKVQNFTLSKINKKSVTITNENETKELNLEKGNENVFISIY